MFSPLHERLTQRGSRMVRTKLGGCSGKGRKRVIKISRGDKMGDDNGTKSVTGKVTLEVDVSKGERPSVGEGSGEEWN